MLDIHQHIHSMTVFSVFNILLLNFNNLYLHQWDFGVHLGILNIGRNF